MPAGIKEEHISKAIIPNKALKSEARVSLDKTNISAVVFQNNILKMVTLTRHRKRHYRELYCIHIPTEIKGNHRSQSFRKVITKTEPPEK